MAPFPFFTSLRLLSVISCLLLYTSAFAPRPYTKASTSGNTNVIQSWKVQSSHMTGDDASKLSSPSLNTSGWYAIGSHGTLMATLLENKVYNDTNLFYSDNLQNVTSSQFSVPWFYRSAIQLPQGNGTHFQLKTNGISSRADVYLNGMLVADKNMQAGAYVGLMYDVTNLTKTGDNILLVKVYPTDYNRDFAIGFVDWNPSPPDNGTGIWRDVEIKQTGPVSISTPRFNSTLRLREARVNIKLDVKNLEINGVRGEVNCKVSDPQGKEIGNPKAGFHLSGKEQQTVDFNLTLKDPLLWWPKQWGAQPLYAASCSASTSNSSISDTTTPTKFGIRTVSKTLEYNATTFIVNDKKFQVIGAGYTSDMFLRFSPEKLRAQFQYAQDLGLNTIRLEGKLEHPYLYELADELGLMIMAGWECCDKWEGWSYNTDSSGEKWTDADYLIANNSMRHEAEMMQHHPSMLAFLVGSDFWPDDRATKIYTDALKAYDWNVPIISSASQRGWSKELGNGGMKMDGPYDWVPPGYWYENQYGAAFDFGSELSSGVGTPELSSLRKFLSPSDIQDLWKNPDSGHYHMSPSPSVFHTRKIYNDALWHRYGAPTSLEDYLLKSQMADYESTRAQFEAYISHFSAGRTATGMIYWMLNNAWPSLHWNLFDYYLHPSGSYFGAHTAASRKEHVMYDYLSSGIWIANRGIDKAGMRTVDIEYIALNGSVLARDSLDSPIEPNSSRFVGWIPGVQETDVALLKLVLHNRRETLSRNVYWLSLQPDVLDWRNSTWYYTPVETYADFTALDRMRAADVVVSVVGSGGGNGTGTGTGTGTGDVDGRRLVVLENRASVPAVFVRMNLVDAGGEDIVPVFWSDNYVTLWPGEKMNITVSFEGSYGGAKILVDGKNVGKQSVSL